MSNFDMDLLKTLRADTGAGLMECKKALQESGMDVKKAILYLKENGVIKAANKSARSTGEGIIVIFCDENLNYIVLEVNCETDFVAKNQTFIDFCNDLAEKILVSKADTVDEIPDFINRQVQDIVVRVGENVKIRRFSKLNACDGFFICPYVHQGFSMAVLLEMGFSKKDTISDDKFLSFAKDVAMHIAAMSPKVISVDEFSDNIIEQQRSLFLKQLKDSGKPDKVIDNIVKGKVKQFFKENALLEQPYVKDDKISVSKFLEHISSELSDSIFVKSFIRFKVGEDL